MAEKWGPDKWGLRLRLGLMFAALAALVPIALALGLALAWRHLQSGSIGPGTALLQLSLIAGGVMLAGVVALWFLFDEHLGRALLRLARRLDAACHAPRSGLSSGLSSGRAVQDLEAMRYLGPAGPAAAALAARLAETEEALEGAVAAQTRALARQRDRLEALLAGVPEALLLLSGDDRLVFYNGPAVTLLAGPAGAAPALGQSLFDHLRAGPVQAAAARLRAGDEPAAATDLLCADLTGERLLAGRMRLVEAADPGDVPGYALSLSEMGAMTGSGKGAERRAETRAETRAADLADALQARLAGRGIALELAAEALLLPCDGLAMLELLEAIVLHMGQAGPARLEIRRDWAGAQLRLSLPGKVEDHGQGRGQDHGQSPAQFRRWLETAGGRESPASALARMGAEAWAEAGHQAGREAGQEGPACVVMLPHARLAPKAGHGAGVVPGQRGCVYDFALLAGEMRGGGDLADQPLERLAYAVFDTETTGLDPARDEIVQIAALRIVNGRAVPGEAFETLVDPGRPIPPRATAVHGISQDMVGDAPDIVAAGRQFHAFVRGAVLVAHNAPFDLQFLRRHGPRMQRAFDQPVLDTVLLSAVVFGRDAAHDLDSLARRLGVTIPEAGRHTAMGDSLATAEVFLRLLPMLRARGITTFGAARAAMRRHGRLLADPNTASTRSRENIAGGTGVIP